MRLDGITRGVLAGEEDTEQFSSFRVVFSSGRTYLQRMPSSYFKANPTSNSPLSTVLIAAANAAVGCAVAMILSEKIGSRGRRTVAWAALAVGVAAVAPAIIDAVTQQISGPNTRRGTRDRLRSIREDSGFADESEVA